MTRSPTTCAATTQFFCESAVLQHPSPQTLYKLQRNAGIKAPKLPIFCWMRMAKVGSEKLKVSEVSKFRIKLVSQNLWKLWKVWNIQRWSKMHLKSVQHRLQNSPQVLFLHVTAFICLRLCYSANVLGPRSQLKDISMGSGFPKSTSWHWTKRSSYRCLNGLTRLSQTTLYRFKQILWTSKKEKKKNSAKLVLWCFGALLYRALQCLSLFLSDASGRFSCAGSGRGLFADSWQHSPLSKWVQHHGGKQTLFNPPSLTLK